MVDIHPASLNGCIEPRDYNPDVNHPAAIRPEPGCEGFIMWILMTLLFIIIGFLLEAFKMIQPSKRPQ